MASRHNRRRTRQPRNHQKRLVLIQAEHSDAPSLVGHNLASPWSHVANSGITFGSTHNAVVFNSRLSNNPLYPQTVSSSRRSPNIWPSPYSTSHHGLETDLEKEQRRIFGGEVGDEVSLCKGMLEVVMGLFDGGLDYVDP